MQNLQISVIAGSRGGVTAERCRKGGVWDWESGNMVEAPTTVHVPDSVRWV